MNMVTIQAQLRGFGRRLLALNVASGMVWGLVAAIVVLVNCAWLDLLWDLPPGVRFTCMIAAVLTLPLIVSVMGRIGQRRRRPHALARRLEGAARSGGQVLSGIELALEGTASSDLTTGLAAMAIERASRLLGGLRPSQVTPVKPLVRSLVGLMLIAAAIGVIAFLSPRLVATQ